MKKQIVTIDELVAQSSARQLAKRKRELKRDKEEVAELLKERKKKADPRPDTRIRDLGEWRFPDHDMIWMIGSDSTGPASRISTRTHVPEFGLIPPDTFRLPNQEVLWAHSLGASPPDKLSLVWDRMMEVFDAQEAMKERARRKRREI